MGLCWVLIAAPPVQGQEQTSPASTQPTIATDRPAITDSSVVVPSGDLLFEHWKRERRVYLIFYDNKFAAMQPSGSTRWA